MRRRDSKCFVCPSDTSHEPLSNTTGGTQTTLAPVCTTSPYPKTLFCSQLLRPSCTVSCFQELIFHHHPGCDIASLGCASLRSLNRHSACIALLVRRHGRLIASDCSLDQALSLVKVAWASSSSEDLVVRRSLRPDVA